MHSMRRFSFRVLPGLFFAVVVIAPSARAQELFKDKNLEAVVRETLKKGEKDPLKEEDLKDLFIMNGNGREIEDLSGLEKCTNLAELKLSNNKLAELKPLSGLKNVQSLYLSDNKISDIGPLSGLTKLQHLELENNQVESVEPLKGLTE
ncbi:MAG: leucine-rich repeat domain-containing protein, partial [Planctomycetes bacterium]|nr:leucine-rich repeat domain-containing protein [Planctomycetota bacterium]